MMGRKMRSDATRHPNDPKKDVLRAMSVCYFFVYHLNFCNSSTSFGPFPTASLKCLKNGAWADDEIINWGMK
jgi:hypothetical protein